MPPGVVVLRIAEVIAKMEDLLLRAASFFDAGQDDELVIGRPQMTLSISTLLKKSKLEGIPKSESKEPHGQGRTCNRWKTPGVGEVFLNKLCPAVSF